MGFINTPEGVTDTSGVEIDLKFPNIWATAYYLFVCICSLARFYFVVRKKMIQSSTNVFTNLLSFILCL